MRTARKTAGIPVQDRIRVDPFDRRCRGGEKDQATFFAAIPEYARAVRYSAMGV